MSLCSCWVSVLCWVWCVGCIAPGVRACIQVSVCPPTVFGACFPHLLHGFLHGAATSACRAADAPLSAVLLPVVPASGASLAAAVIHLEPREYLTAAEGGRVPALASGHEVGGR